MANPSTILAWRIPWTEEPCELQSMGLHRILVVACGSFSCSIWDLGPLHWECGVLATREVLELEILNWELRDYVVGFPGGSEVKASASNAGDPASIPGSERSPGEGNGNPLHYSCLENPMD